MELASGAFDRVVKAEAVGLVTRNGAETVNTVAVKMVRSQLLPQNQMAAPEALVSKLKVMIHLGPHLNVVNLLIGACTKNISKGKFQIKIQSNSIQRMKMRLITGEVLVLVEYCRFGNLLSNVINARGRFINQVDSVGNLIINFDQQQQESISGRPINDTDDDYITVEET